MTRPTRLDLAAVDAWITQHPGWKRTAEDALAKSYKFPDFSAALAFVVRLGLIAEKRDHHPDVELKWGSVRTIWSTHDAGGVTQLDLNAAEAADALAG
jgi:4a-hydroxytetrahydrobiopterin dehydratase